MLSFLTFFSVHYLCIACVLFRRKEGEMTMGKLRTKRGKCGDGVNEEDEDMRRLENSTEDISISPSCWYSWFS